MFDSCDFMNVKLDYINNRMLNQFIYFNKVYSNLL